MRLISIILLSLVLAVPLMAQDKNEYPQSGVEFGLPQDIGVDNFGPEQVNGYDFSWTWRNSETRGWRIGMSLGGSKTDSNALTDYQENGRVEFRDSDALVTVLKYQHLFKTKPRQGTSLVFGVGPALSFSNSSSSRLRNGDDMSIQLTSASRNTFGAGVVWDLGVEWRASELFSVSARYEWDLTYSESDRKEATYFDGELYSHNATDEYRYGLQSSNEIDLLVTFWY
jgi:hypothetical protein